MFTWRQTKNTVGKLAPVIFGFYKSINEFKVDISLKSSLSLLRLSVLLLRLVKYFKRLIKT